MKPLLILGSGTFAVETLDIAERTGEFEALGFVNSIAPPPPGTLLEGLPIFGLDGVPHHPESCFVVAGIVSTKRRGFIEEMMRRGYRFISVIHPSAIISRRSSLGDGCVVGAGVVVSPHTRIEDHVILNRGCLIGHDNQIGCFCTLGPGANCAGGLQFGEGVYVGVGAVIRDHVSIGTGAVIGAGAVVVESVPANVLVVGLPARVVKTGVEGM